MYKVDNHAQLKKKILAAISTMGTHSLIDHDQKISNSDWHLSPNFARPYAAHIDGLITNHLNKLMQASGVSENDKLSLKNYWFQQYAEGDHHDWHIHGGCVFSNVYYVDLPKNAAKTTFKYGSEIFSVDVEEGYILSFPSCYSHCSKPNEASTKTIISFNY
jgi:hypothetical protein